MKLTIVAFLVLGLAGTVQSEDMPLELFQTLNNKLKEAETVPEATFEFLALVAANEDAIHKATTSQMAIQRTLAAVCLGMAKEKRKAVDTLLSLLQDADRKVREAACESLAALRDARAVDALTKVLTEDEAVWVRAEAASALGAIKDDQSIQPLAKRLSEDPSREVRSFCAMALGRFAKSYPEAAKALADALETENDPLVRNTIALTLGKAMELQPIEPEGDKQSDARKKLGELSGRMKEMEDKLRADRHDELVQADGDDIEKQLASLIDDLEQGQQKQEQQQQKKNPQKQKREVAQGKSSPKQPGQAGPGSGSGESAKLDSAKIDRHQDKWAQLPPKARDELLQTYAYDLPMKWRKRLEAYFVSIAAEEVKHKR